MPEWANKSIGRHLQSLLDDINEAMPDEKRQASHKAA
jgi:hypothetical protein